MLIPDSPNRFETSRPDHRWCDKGSTDSSAIAKLSIGRSMGFDSYQQHRMDPSGPLSPCQPLSEQAYCRKDLDEPTGALNFLPRSDISSERLLIWIGRSGAIRWLNGRRLLRLLEV